MECNSMQATYTPATAEAGMWQRLKQLKHANDTCQPFSIKDMKVNFTKSRTRVHFDVDQSCLV